VKCNKVNPCSNCVKQNIRCEFPSPGRAPRRRKVVDRNSITRGGALTEREGELLKRLRRLEGVVQSLTEQTEKEKSDEDDEDHRSPKSPTLPVEPKCIVPATVNIDKEITAVDERLGRLVVDGRKSRYVSSSFWASLSDEVGSRLMNKATFDAIC
jgi:hypothetical protein